MCAGPLTKFRTKSREFASVQATGCPVESNYEGLRRSTLSTDANFTSGRAERYNKTKTFDGPERERQEDGEGGEESERAVGSQPPRRYHARGGGDAGEDRRLERL